MHPPSCQHFTRIINSISERIVGWHTGNGANFGLFWACEAKGILPKKTEVFISGAFFLWFVSFWANKKK
jgi:hypothetical protein